MILKWVREGVLDGLRVDHPDGLRDPAANISVGSTRRSRMAGSWSRRSSSRASPSPKAGRSRGPPVTTSSTGSAASSSTRPAKGRSPTSTRPSPASRSTTRRWSATRSIMCSRRLFGSDVNRLVTLLSDVCEHQKRYRDYTRRELTTMLREVIACFPVYRTYVQAEQGQVSDRDIRYINEAIDAAKANRPEIDSELARLPARPPDPQGPRQGRVALRHAVPAEYRPGDGQGARRHRLLQLQPTGRSQRGRRRSRPIRDLAREVPRGLPSKPSASGRPR